MRLLLIAGLLAACKGESPATSSSTPTPTDGPTPTDSPTQPGTPQPCGALIVSSNPSNGATGVDVDAEIRVQYNAVVTASDTWSLGVSNVTGTSTLNADGMGATFVPDAPLDYDTIYAIEASACEEGVLHTFTTGPAPLQDDQIEGKTYAVAFPNILFTSPPQGILDLVDFADFIIVQIVEIDDVTREFSANAGSANFNGGVVVEDCQYAFDAGTGDLSSSPELEVGPSDFVLPLGGNNITIEDFTLTGTFGANGDVITDLAISGMMDTRGIVGFGDLCFLAQLGGFSCQQCSDGAPRCIPVAATADQADWDPNLDIAANCAI